MASPTLWSKRPFFYPIGNTPAVCLTQGLAPEVPADILLLGCGDPRNILKTIHFESDNGTRKLDFTCCDLEPAVLARNILLLSAIADGVPWQNAWHFFYHIFIDNTSLKILLSQCRKLIDSSHDLTTWNSSGYGKYIAFCTEGSMIEIRQQWELYLATDNLSQQEKNVLRKSFSSRMKQIYKKYGDEIDIRMARAAGPFNLTASLLAGPSLFCTFWEDGITKASTTKTGIPPNVNLTFVYSLAGSEFNVHYQTNPLVAFDHSLALSPIKGTPFRSSQITGPDLVRCAMNQFSTWYTSFRSRANAPKSTVMIRIFAGDCIPFCHALRRCRSDRVTMTEIYSRPWGLTQINFTKDYESTSSSAPLLFNVIDTSNLTDHLGLLNIVLVAAPLLQRTPWSVLQTDTFRSSTSDRDVEFALLDRAFCDIPTLSILLGIAPSFHLYPFSTECCKNEQLIKGILEGELFDQRVSWKRPRPFSVAPYLAPAYPDMQEECPFFFCDERLLAEFLFSVYLQIFSEENAAHLISKTTVRYTVDNPHYIRMSFIVFLSLVKERVQVDCSMTMQHFVNLLEADTKLTFGMTSYQDFICQMYLHNIYTLGPLRWDTLRLIRSSGDYFDGWQAVPPVVSVVLIVPREHLKFLEDGDRRDIGFPILFCDTRGSITQNMHPSIHFTFGTAVYSGRYADARVVITEDPAGWHGKAPMVLSFDAASWLFTKRGGIQSVGLCVRASPLFSKTLYSKFGLNGRLFSAQVTDMKHVFITKHRPNDSREICRANDNASLTTVQDRSAMGPSITVDFNASTTRIESLAVRNNIVGQDAAKTIATGVPISTKVIGDTAILASFRGYSQLFHFPFPIDTSRVKTRIARKSLYIEIVAPLRRDIGSSEPAIAPLNLFPIALTKTSFNLLNVSYLKLSTLPALRLPLSSDNLQFLSSHLALALSKQQLTPGHGEKLGMIVNLKESISAIILKASELGVPQVFGLGVYAFLLLNDLKLDVTSQTVVVDACVIPLNETNAAKVIPAFSRCRSTGTVMISVVGEEARAWKALLPAFVERCRTWNHNGTCEYRKRGIPACSMDDDWDMKTSPLCSCGLGKDLGGFTAVNDWKAIRSEATRIAISPVFPLLPLQQSLAIPEALAKVLKSSSSDGNVCARCGGSGQPKLMVCGRCKKIQYCSQKCQKAHWKQHKANCTEK